jgi:Zn-dependent peptidase ImmA (M78 family)
MTPFIPDRVGGLSRRPYKLAQEIEAECEHCLRRYWDLGPAEPLPVPVSTADLVCLIEASAERLDLYADMAADVEGLTVIARDRRPFVRINRLLSATPSRTNRLRSTLAHEWYHLVFHAPLYQEAWKQLDLFSATGELMHCTRSSILGGTPGDWREWQAAYGAGALLMPASALQRLSRELARRHGPPPYPLGSRDGNAVILRVASDFAVSQDAARVRLTPKGLLASPSDPRQPRLLPPEEA